MLRRLLVRISSVAWGVDTWIYFRPSRRLNSSKIVSYRIALGFGWFLWLSLDQPFLRLRKWNKKLVRSNRQMQDDLPDSIQHGWVLFAAVRCLHSSKLWQSEPKELETVQHPQTQIKLSVNLVAKDSRPVCFKFRFKSRRRVSQMRLI